MSTTSVRKVRVRSIDALRDLTFGTALMSAAATVWDIDDMRASPAKVTAQDIATGNRIEQACSRLLPARDVRTHVDASVCCASYRYLQPLLSELLPAQWGSQKPEHGAEP